MDIIKYIIELFLIGLGSIGFWFILWFLIIWVDKF